MALKAIQRGKASNGCTNLSWWKNFATLWICALFSPKSKQKWKSSENLPKEGKNLPLEFHNFWKIDFGEISASFYRTNKGSRLQIWALFSRSKKLFSKPSLDTGMDDKNRPWWLSDLPPPQTFFLTFFWLNRFEFWIPTSWCLVCSDSRQSFSWRSYGYLKVCFGLLFAFI